LLHVDALKALAAQAIVLHHLSAYGPIADAVQTMVPALIELLFRHGRLAVQVFLVVGGFLSARGLSRRGQALEGAVPELLWRRYLRLVLPFMAAVGLSLVCGLLVKPWLPDLVPEEITLVQLVSHALLLQGVLGHEALTAGAWYVAVDFQLFALLLLLLWLARSLKVPRAWRVYAGPLLVLAVAAASLWVFNRDSALDDWALYFFGAYGLGALVHWIGLSHRPRIYLALLVGVGLMALALEWRERVAVALVTAIVLALLHMRHQRAAVASRSGDIASEFSTHSYALFLVHYPVCLLVNALFEQQGLSGGVAGLSMMVMAWGLANLASIPFHRWIEAPASRLRWGRFANRALQA
jgi:peptidoglycan/LPS O-acetylase OafA/YrhL